MASTNSILINEDNEDWALIPSDPAIFDDMIKQYGIKDTKVQEVLSLDFEDITRGGPVYGLIFISRYVEDLLPNSFEDIDPDTEKVIFTAQVVTNVCGTLALLAVLFNADIEKGTILDNFLTFTKDFSPMDRGLCLGNSPEIRNIHDAYATAHYRADKAYNDNISEISEGDGMEYIDADDYHYITYIHKDGFLWELDGLKVRPVKLAPCDENTWLERVRPILEKHMNERMGDEITFSLMAVTKDPYPFILKEYATYSNCIQKARQVLDRPKPYSASRIYRIKKLIFEELDPTMPQYTLIKDMWQNIYAGHREQCEQQLDTLSLFHKELQQIIKNHDEVQAIAAADVNRQKFDYFPFVTKLIEIIYNREFKNESEKEKPAPSQTKKKGRGSIFKNSSTTADANTRS